MTDLAQPAFLLGAGFNRDAKREAGTIFGRSIYLGEYKIDVAYPLVADALSICFPGVAHSENQSVEDLFADSQLRGDQLPLTRLADALMKADYYLASRLQSDPGSSYARFFSKFAAATFMTFNYDALVDSFLVSTGQWTPRDGYGVPVDAELMVGFRGSIPSQSIPRVLHLHGSFCIYPSDAFEHWNRDRTYADIRLREHPQFIFDPDSVGSLFIPFERLLPALGYVEPARRVIAPVPNKASGLRKEFVRATYAEALLTLKRSPALIAIGYSFGVTDHASYAPLLQALSFEGSRNLVVVDPDANAIVPRLRREFTTLRVEPCQCTFAQWVERGASISVGA